MSIFDYFIDLIIQLSKVMIHSHALMYSVSQEITVGKLKELNYDPNIDTSFIFRWMQNHQIKAIVEGEIDYHSKFSKIPSKPYIIYYKGNLDLLNKPLLGIVGPRKHSDFAKTMVQKVINQAKNQDLATVSGLATGIDQLTHIHSLENNIPTIAVLGGGFNYYIKSKDRELIHRIVDQGGLILSEFKLAQDPQSYTFPQRNRIIAGLADVLFVPEASKNSGSLITVEFAQKLKKPIYGTPNPNGSSSTNEGLHELLQNGLIRPLLDIPVMFKTHFSVNIYQKHNTEFILYQSNIDPDIKKILKIFQNHDLISISVLLKEGFSLEKIYSILTQLEMEKVIIQPTPGFYSLV